jgi:methionyl-tRNA synthetase
VDEFGLDQTRYFLMREVPFGNDGNFSRQGMINRVNSELSNNIGNLAQRTLSIINKNCDGMIPQPGAYTPEDKSLLDLCENLSILQSDAGGSLYDLMMGQQFHIAMEKIIELSSAANAYIDIQAPWKLKKDDPERMKTVLYVLYCVIRKISIYLQPFTPDSSSRMLDQLAVPENTRDFAHAGMAFCPRPGTVLPPPQPVFLRFTEKAA